MEQEAQERVDREEGNCHGVSYGPSAAAGHAASAIHACQVCVECGEAGKDSPTPPSAWPSECSSIVYFYVTDN